MDSGVVHGSIISQFYDPMVSKLIAYSPNHRKEAIKGLSGALDRYRISGIMHNCAFLSDVLRHQAFIDGETPTDFIDLHYPGGFAGVSLSSVQKGELAAIAADSSFMRRSILQRPSNPLYPKQDEGDKISESIVCLGGMFGTPYLIQVTEEGDTKVTPYGEDTTSQLVEIHGMKLGASSPTMSATINGKKKTLQIGIEDSTGAFSMTYEGANMEIIVMSLKEYELSRHMQEPKKIDTSDMILSPMPGTLISYSVEKGDRVVEHQDICIIEAMKMQNVIRAPRSGVIKELRAEEGSSLMTDEVIVEFEQTE